MNISKYIIISAILTSSCIFTSCEKEIEVDLKTAEPKLVIEGLISADSLASVKLSMTKSFYSDNTFEPILGANVSISDDKGNSEQLQTDDKGIYKSKTLKGVPGRTYQLNVKVDDKEYTASSTMSPHSVPIDTITMFYVGLYGYASPMVHFTDPKGSKNYYREVLYINGERKKLDNDATDTDRTEGFRMSRLIAVPRDNGSTEDPIKKGDTITVEHQLLDKGAYLFFDSLGRIKSSQTNPTNNISGGALGYFSAYTFDRKTIIADWKE